MNRFLSLKHSAFNELNLDYAVSSSEASLFLIGCEWPCWQDTEATCLADERHSTLRVAPLVIDSFRSPLHLPIHFPPTRTTQSPDGSRPARTWGVNDMDPCEEDKVGSFKRGLQVCVCVPRATKPSGSRVLCQGDSIDVRAFIYPLGFCLSLLCVLTDIDVSLTRTLCSTYSEPVQTQVQSPFGTTAASCRRFLQFPVF